MAYLSAVILASALGAVIASFLNVVADRIPRGQSVLGPPSHCPDCGHQLAPLELVPVFSYLALRGRCRVCRGRIPARVPMAEAAGAVLFGFAVWRYGVTADAVLAAVFFGFLLLIAIIDLEHKLVLNKVPLLALPVAFVSTLAWSPDLREPVLLLDSWYLSLVVDALAAGLAGFLIFVTLAVLSRGGMGGGDVKLAGVVGVWLGLKLLPVALLLAVLFGGATALALLVSRSLRRKDAIPFAPFLCAGAGAGLVWGEAIGNWYLGLLGV